MATVQGLYKGFSSFEFQRRKTFKIRDIELVKLDLLNHIFTKRGERVMMPTFGTVIPEMTFEPLDGTTIDIVRSEVERVLDFDPRVETLKLEVQPDYDNGSLYVGAQVLYVELNLVDNLELNIQFGV
jgi:phage baseplate assembly protein W